MRPRLSKTATRHRTTRLAGLARLSTQQRPIRAWSTGRWFAGPRRFGGGRWLTAGRQRPTGLSISAPSINQVSITAIPTIRQSHHHRHVIGPINPSIRLFLSPGPGQVSTASTGRKTQQTASHGGDSSADRLVHATGSGLGQAGRGDARRHSSQPSAGSDFQRQILRFANQTAGRRRSDKATAWVSVNGSHDPFDTSALPVGLTMASRLAAVARTGSGADGSGRSTFGRSAFGPSPQVLPVAKPPATTVAAPAPVVGAAPVPTAPEMPYEPRTSAGVTAWTNPAPTDGPVDVDRLTEKVVAAIDKRLIAHRERMGGR